VACGKYVLQPGERITVRCTLAEEDFHFRFTYESGHQSVLTRFLEPMGAAAAAVETITLG
jgi:hypothetical protein